MSDDQRENTDDMEELEAVKVNKGLTMGQLSEMCKADPDQAYKIIIDVLSGAMGETATNIPAIIGAFVQNTMLGMARALRGIPNLPNALLKIMLLADIIEENPKYSAYLDENGEKDLDRLFDSTDPADMAFIEELGQELNKKYNEYIENIDKPAVKEKGIVTQKAKDIPLALDKANMDLFNPFKYEKINGQFRFLFENASDKEKRKGITARATYSLQADAELLKELGVSDRLTAYDERVCGAVAAIYNAGNEIMTLSQIYAAMGNEGRPNTTQLKNIDKSLQKMRVTILSMNFDDERKAHKDKDLINYNSSFLPYEQVKRTINGRLAEAAIHVFREPPLISAAKQRNQITTLPIKLLVSKLSQTTENIAIQNLLLKRIARMKNKKTGSSNKIRYAYIIDELAIKRNKNRVIDKIYTYLQEFKDNGYIKSFKESDIDSGDPGVEITY